MFIDMGSTASGRGVLESWEHSFLTHLVLLPGSKQRLSREPAINLRPGQYPQVRESAAHTVDVINYSDRKQLEEERVCFTLWFLKESVHGLKGKEGMVAGTRNWTIT